MICFNALKRFTLTSKGLFQSRPVSTRHLGNTFELYTVEFLKNYRFKVRCCGGPSDRGVDFRGVWNLTSCEVSILGQCKCYKRRLGPVHIRELEGTLSHEQENTLGMMVTNVGFTRDAYQHFMSSTFPLALTVLDYTHINYMDIESNFDSVSGDSLKSEFQDDWLPCSEGKDCGSRASKTEGVERSLNEESDCKSIERTYLCNDNNNNNSSSSSNNYMNNVCSYSSDITYNDTQKLMQVKDSKMNDGTGEVSVCGELLLFDLNVTARCLLPSVVIGKTMNKRNNGSPTLLQLENETVTTIT